MQMKYMAIFYLYSKNIKEFPRMDCFSLSKDCGTQMSEQRTERLRPSVSLGTLFKT